MSTPASMEARLAVDECGADTYRSQRAPAKGHVFGGLLLGQALQAARRTVTADRLPRSISASFLVAATGGEPVTYAVERTRDGASFSTRRVVASQAVGAVLVLTADFHVDEPGVAYEPPALEAVPPPHDCPPGRYLSRWFDCRDVPVAPGDARPPHARRSWFHPTAELGDDPALHLEALVYLSDHGPTRAARQPHAELGDDSRRMSVSLDHTIWLHRPERVDQWLLFELAPAFTGGGRGLSLGTIRTAEGLLIATVAQEVLLRSR